MKRIMSFIMSVMMAVTALCGTFTVSAEESGEGTAPYPINDLVSYDAIKLDDEEAAELDKLAEENEKVIEEDYVSVSQEELKYFTNDYTKGYFYQQMNADEKAFCQEVYELATKLLLSNTDLAGSESSGYIYYLIGKVSRHNITNDQRMAQVYRLFLSENPQLFFVTGFIVFSSSELYVCAYDEFAAAANRDAISSSIINTVAGLPNELDTMTNALDKIKRIAYFIVETTEYVDENSSAYSQTIAGSLGRKKSVCAGYTAAAVYLCNMAGIPSIFVRNEGVHGWNRVKILGKWYELDTTWMDNGVSGSVNTDWYLKSTATFQANDQQNAHVATSSNYDGFTLPECLYDDPVLIVITGDADEDGELTLKDVMIVGRACISGKGEEYLDIADVDSDNAITLKDVMMLGRMVIGGN